MKNDSLPHIVEKIKVFILYNLIKKGEKKRVALGKANESDLE